MAEPRKPVNNPKSTKAASPSPGSRGAVKGAGSTKRTGSKSSNALISGNTIKTPALGKTVSPADRWKMIADTAFFKAERRGFAPGGEVADWLAAEMEVDTLLKGRNKKDAKAS